MVIRVNLKKDLGITLRHGETQATTIGETQASTNGVSQASMYGVLPIQ